MIPSTEELRELVIKEFNSKNIPINIDNPVTIQDKIAWLKVYDVNELKTKCSDKILVHEYATEILGKDICVPIYKVYDTVDDINFDILPSKFVLKANHGSAMNIVVKNKYELNYSFIKNTLTNFLNTDYSIKYNEYQYANINRKVFSEQYLCNDVIDYKICCFNGKPKILEICFDRDLEKHAVKYNYYDEYLNPLYIEEQSTPSNYNVNIDLIKPRNFELMKEYARKLSSNFKFVRVDFYEVDNTVYLGEMTFTPVAGHLRYTNDEQMHISEMFGNMLNLETVNVNIASYPARDKYLPAAVENLKKQTLQPDRIIIWLSNQKYDKNNLPEYIKQLKTDPQVFIKFIDEYGVFKRYYCFKYFNSDYNIFLDDDIIYGDTIIEELVNAAKQNKNCITTYASDKAEYIGTSVKWEHYTEEPSFYNYMMGGLSCFPPNVIPDELTKEFFDKLKEARNINIFCDEGYFKPLIIKYNIKTNVIKKWEEFINNITYFEESQSDKCMYHKFNVTNEYNIREKERQFYDSVKLHKMENKVKELWPEIELNYKNKS